LEEDIALQIDRAGIPVVYEEDVLKYVKPSRASRYTPDFRLPNGIHIEGKGRFVSADRVKHLLIKEQHPDLDIRFIFSRSAARLSPTSSTTYGDWCDKHGFKYADKAIPKSWFKEVKHGSR
jgi:hypothetical protein